MSPTAFQPLIILLPISFSLSLSSSSTFPLFTQPRAAPDAPPPSKEAIFGTPVGEGGDGDVSDSELLPVDTLSDDEGAARKGESDSEDEAEEEQVHVTKVE